MASKLFIYLVSADEPFIGRIRDRLAQEVDFNIHRTAASCRAALSHRRPDLIILDTNLPEDSGFALHRELADDFDTGDIYQLLLCAADCVAREGYAAQDQLIRPVSDELFWRKLEQLRKLFEKDAATREQMAYAQSVAFTSMSSMGELGVVMQFLSKSFACATIQSVTELAVESLRQYELEGAIYALWEGDGLIRTTDGGELPERYRTLIDQRRTLGRLLEIDRNLSVNYDHVSLLVTNLPESDPQRVGRIRDNLATLAEGIESRIQGLLLVHDNILKQQGIRYAVWEIRESVKNLNERQAADLNNTSVLTNRVIDEFEEAFLHMGMLPEIENQLIGELVELRRKIAEIIGRPGEVHSKLQTVIAALETMAGQVGMPDAVGSCEQPA
jgi:response regulator of citrate/malate metabolism